MGSACQTRKRVFVKVLPRLAAPYKLVCGVNRDSTDAQVDSAFRTVAAKCHPDKGGDPEHAKELHAARDEWKKGPRATSNTGDDAVLPTSWFTACSSQKKKEVSASVCCAPRA